MFQHGYIFYRTTGTFMILVFLLASLPTEVVAQEAGSIILMECEPGSDESGEDSDKSQSKITYGKLEKRFPYALSDLLSRDFSRGTWIAWHTSDSAVHLEEPSVPPPEI
ncbi:MAG: hypothetical protein AAGN35_15135 [Bacteroidota bacterium]